MNRDVLTQLRRAEDKGFSLLAAVESRGLIRAGPTEEELSEEIHALAEEMFGLQRYWHKRVVRAGENTLQPFRETPPNRTIETDDILFVDLGPVFGDWEADVGRTYVIGHDARKHALKHDVEAAWAEGHAYFHRRRGALTGAELFAFTASVAQRMGWACGGPHCGHLIGAFPHLRVQGTQVENYIHPDNHLAMRESDAEGRRRYWIYEIHFVDLERGIGAFTERWIGDYED